jgi:hypothetical protein
MFITYLNEVLVVIQMNTAYLGNFCLTSTTGYFHEGKTNTIRKQN